jgi:hypothetical protein
LCEVVEVLDGQDQAEVRDGYVVAVDRIAGALAGRVRDQVRDELVAAQVPVDPGVGAAALRAAEHVAVEVSGVGQVVHRDREMESWEVGHGP